MFRINRDVRFSTNKAPYKTNFGAALNPQGKKSGLAGLYVHLEPGGSFVGGGLWMPPTPIIHKVRQEIDYQTNEFLSIINKPSFKPQIKIVCGLQYVERRGFLQQRRSKNSSQTTVGPPAVVSIYESRTHRLIFHPERDILNCFYIFEEIYC